MIEAIDLEKRFSSGGMLKKRYATAVDDISFRIEKGETFGLVGVSGCGKTTAGKLILRLIEPTSGLDVSVQAQILNLMNDLKRDLELTTMFITHDLEVARQMCERIAVMYRGTILEMGVTEEIFSRPRHPSKYRDLFGQDSIFQPGMKRLVGENVHPPVRGVFQLVFEVGEV
jgi:ABC-type oligopeptide transport system ATPase subunit